LDEISYVYECVLFFIVSFVDDLLSLFSAATKGLPFTNDKQVLSSDSVRFLVLADWGGSPYPPFTTGVQVRVAHQMALKAEKEKVSFVLALGDNFYMNGVVGFYDERFKVVVSFPFLFMYKTISIVYMVLHVTLFKANY
jgi:uncharacterized protein YneR